MYTTHKLKNGIPVVMSHLPQYRSVSIGVWIKTGSIDETQASNGISHFIEHMLFKGTTSYSARDIAEIFDSVGGDLNAFTSKECTCFHGRVLDNHLAIPIKIIADMIQNPLLDEKDIEKEKGVVLDEILMADDTPDDVSYDLIAKTIYNNGSLSRPILGTEDNLKYFSYETITDHLNQFYTTDNMVISLAGSFDEEEALLLLNEHFNMTGCTHNSVDSINDFHVGGDFIYRDIEQIHLEIGFKGLPYSKEEIFDLAALNNILGASVSSRLFQNIREAEGLTYTINSYLTQYEKTGLLSIYASMQSDNLKTVVQLIQRELETLINNGITDKELIRVKEQLKGNYILDLESTDSYMNLIGKGTLFKIPIRTPEEVEKAIDGISKESVNSLIMSILNTKPSVALVGRVDKNHLLQCINILGGEYEATCKDH